MEIDLIENEDDDTFFDAIDDLNTASDAENEFRFDDDNESETNLEEEEDYNTESGYYKTLKGLAEEWMMTENHHRVSKEASNSLFEVAKKWFHKLYEAKEKEGIFRNTPQFVQLREHIHKKNTPTVYLEIAYKDKITEEVIVLKDLESTPISKYPPSRYEKLYESASVKVKQLL